MWTASYSKAASVWRGGPGLPESGSGPESPQPTLPCLPLSPPPKARCPGEGQALEVTLSWLLMRGRARGVSAALQTPDSLPLQLRSSLPGPPPLASLLPGPAHSFTFPASPASCPPQLKVLHVQDIMPTLCNSLFMCLHSHTGVGGVGAASDSFVCPWPLA